MDLINSVTDSVKSGLKQDAEKSIDVEVAVDMYTTEGPLLRGIPVVPARLLTYLEHRGDQHS